jgi:hypothetical protein
VPDILPGTGLVCRSRSGFSENGRPSGAAKPDPSESESQKLQATRGSRRVRAGRRITWTHLILSWICVTWSEPEVHFTIQRIFLRCALPLLIVTIPLHSRNPPRGDHKLSLTSRNGCQRTRHPQWTALAMRSVLTDLIAR